MNIYKLKAGGNFKYLSFTNENDWDILIPPNTPPSTDNWVPRSVELVSDGGNLPMSDFPYFGTFPVFNEKALQALGDILKGKGDILPLKSKDGNFSLFNVTNTIDVINLKKSIVKKAASGLIWDVVKGVFYDGKVKEEDIIFTIPQSLTLIFVTDIFLNRVKQAKLTGFVFKKVS